MNQNRQNNVTLEWPQASSFKNSIRLEFSLFVGGLIMVLMLVTGYIVTSKYSETVTAGIIENLVVQAHSFSESAGKLIISSDAPDELMLNSICQKLANNNPDLYWAGIADEKGKFLAHTDIKQVITESKFENRPSARSKSHELSGGSVSYSADTIIIQIPIKENDIVVGWLGMAASSAKIASARIGSIITVASITAIMIMLGIPVTLFILNRKLKPIKLITNGLKGLDYNKLDVNISFESRNEFGYLSETLRVMGIKLKAAQQDMLENERITRELEIAREIQAKILPRKFPKGDRFEFYGTYRSAREVGGDYYDFIDIDQDNMAFLVADVSGKSLPGMLVMLLTRDIVQTLSRTIHDPSKILTMVNSELRTNIKKGMFVTMFFGLLNKKNGLFSFASAGHNPLIFVNNKTGEIDLIKTHGFPLGMVPTEAFEQRIETRQLTLGDNDWLIQYTDGINEAHNPAGEEYGMERFTESIKKSKDLKPSEIVDNILGNHDAFVGNAGQFDDITLVAMKWSTELSDNKINGSKYELYADRG